FLMCLKGWVMSYKRLGDYITEKVEFNDNNNCKLLQGVSNRKYFQKAKTNTIGIDLSKYRVAHHNQFVFNRATTRNSDRISVALRKGKTCIVSPSYRIFEVKDENILNPDYLLMWFKRPEFDRYARFKSHGSAHEFFDMNEMEDVELPIPSIEKQRELVAQYQSISNKIKVNEQICEKLEATAQTLYRQWFVDFEFPNSPPSEGCPTGGVVDSLSRSNMLNSISGNINQEGGAVESPTQQINMVDSQPITVQRNSKNYFSLPFNPALKDRAKALRKAKNLAEVLFWQQVRNKQFLGLDFDRQKIIGNYIVDFYNANYQVVVEIDGSSHDNKQEYDTARDAYLESLGLTIIHITDRQVKKEMESVMRYLEDHKAFQEVKTDHPALQAPLQGRGTLGYKSSGGAMVYNEELDMEIPEGWEVGVLGNIATFSNTRIEVSKLSLENYVSTENMLQNKKGIEAIKSLPEAKTATKFENGDILISNIRPYLKKIWYSDKIGGCSNDVLCIRCNNDKHEHFVLNTLWNDSFFDYIMQGAKGTKMPRGDKDWIMSFSVIIPTEDVLDKYVNCVSTFKNITKRKQLTNQKLTLIQTLLLSRLATLEKENY
ncbi:MAG: DUF559 domain-containing protein, partial [Gelidibacter sp.]